MATKKKTWDTMDPDERELEVRRLMAEGGSNSSVAKELGTTLGAIAGIRYKKKIPSTHDVPSFSKPKAAPKQAPKPPPRAAPTEVQKSSGPPPPPKYKLAASEAVQCHAHDEDNRRCGYERMQGSNYCPLPQHQALQESPARR